MNVDQKKYENKPRCPGGCTAADQLVIASDGRQFEKCRDCENIIRQIYQVDEKECKHEGARVKLTSKSAKNPGREYYKCEECGAFIGWVDEVDEREAKRSKKRPRAEGGSSCPVDTTKEEWDLHKKRVESMERMLHQIAAKILVDGSTVDASVPTTN